MLAQIFRDTGITVADINDPEFRLPIQTFWTVFDNVVDIFGEDWFLNFPILWSHELQMEVGLAMRLAPNFGEALDLVTTYWLPRWPIGEIISTNMVAERHLTISPVFEMKEKTWAVALSVLALNFAAMQKSVMADARFPQTIRYEFGFERPPYADRLSQLIDAELIWEQPGSKLIVPNDMLKVPSVLANKKQLDNLLEVIGKSGAPEVSASRSTGDDVSMLLDAVERGQATSDQIAKQLGLSKRSLERRLMDEGTSFREISTASLKKRISILLLVPGNNAETIAYQLGYHDGSSIMRACKRWFGKPLSEVRAELKNSVKHS